MDLDTVADGIGPNVFKQLKKWMAQTYRSDMSRRNVVWDRVAENAESLSAAYAGNNLDRMAYSIDRLNNDIHNTQELVLGKFSSELEQAFNTAHNADHPKEYKQYVPRDLRSIRVIESALKNFA